MYNYHLNNNKIIITIMPGQETKLGTSTSKMLVNTEIPLI
jgi:hypothetical protein